MTAVRRSIDETSNLDAAVVAPEAVRARPGARTALPRRTASWPPVLTMQDLADLLGLQSERAARNFVIRCEVPHVKEGRRILVLLSTLLEWLASRQVTSQRGARVRGVVDALRGRRTRVAEAVRKTPIASS